MEGIALDLSDCTIEDTVGLSRQAIVTAFSDGSASVEVRYGYMVDALRTRSRSILYLLSATRADSREWDQKQLLDRLFSIPVILGSDAPNIHTFFCFS